MSETVAIADTCKAPHWTCSGSACTNCLCGVRLETSNLDALFKQADASLDSLKVAVCLRDELQPGAWLRESVRALKPGGEMRFTLLAEKRGGNMSPAYLMSWLDEHRQWTMQRTAGGDILLWLRKNYA